MIRPQMRRKRIAVALSWEMRGQTEGIVRYAHQAGWSLRFLGPMDGNEIRAWKPDGIVSQLYHIHKDLVDAIQSSGAPVVDLYEFVPALHAPRVRVDATAAGRAAAEHFLERRFRRLVHVGRRDWPADNNYLLGFDAGAKAEGVDVLHVMVDDPVMMKKYNIWDRHFGLTGDRYPQFIRDLVAELTRAGKPPVGVFSQNTLLALDVVDEVLNRGFHIPEQVALLTLWERPDENELAHVPLSYIRDDYKTQGYRAAETLDLLLQGTSVPAVQWIPPLPVTALESTDTLAMPHHPTALAMKHLREHALKSGFAPKLAARNLGVTLRTLQRWFDRHVGQSPADYIEVRRVRHAAGLLKSSNLSVQQVAHLAGFSDHRHLRRALWKHERCTPQSLRAAVQRHTRKTEELRQQERARRCTHGRSPAIHARNT